MSIYDIVIVLFFVIPITALVTSFFWIAAFIQYMEEGTKEND